MVNHDDQSDLSAESKETIALGRQREILTTRLRDPRLAPFDVALFSCATGSASEPKSSSSNKQCFFNCVTKSGESFVKVINIARKLPFATRYTVVNAAHNLLDCLLSGIVFYFVLSRCGFDG